MNVEYPEDEMASREGRLLTLFLIACIALGNAIVWFAVIRFLVNAAT